MSRVAKNPIIIPVDVEVGIDDGLLRISGKQGSLSLSISRLVNVIKDKGQLVFIPSSGSKQANAMSGTMRALVANMIKGVAGGFEKRLQLIGVGYRAQAQGNTLNLSLGFSHPISYEMPDSVLVKTPSQTEIILTGPDKQIIGQVAAEIRGFRSPEPYKGKGVRYVDEVVLIKETKKK